MLLKMEALVREIPDKSAWHPTEPDGPLQPPAFPGSIGPFVQQNEPHRCASEVRAFEQDGSDTSRPSSRRRESDWRSAASCNPAPQVGALAAPVCSR